MQPKDEQTKDKLEEILDGLVRQLKSFWSVEIQDTDRMKKSIQSALQETEKSFGVSENKYFAANGFSVFNSVQYSVFLYYLAKKVGGGVLADQLYYLNKIMNGVDWYWQVDLPEHFIAEHPIGTVLGRAEYGDYLCVYQGVTVGGIRKAGKLYYPSLGGYNILYSNASVLGDSHIGSHVIIGANTFVRNETIPSHSIVVGCSPDLRIKRCDEETIKSYLNQVWKC